MVVSKGGFRRGDGRCALFPSGQVALDLLGEDVVGANEPRRSGENVAQEVEGFVLLALVAEGVG